jgi:hypothetical protein
VATPYASAQVEKPATRKVRVAVSIFWKSDFVHPEFRKNDVKIAALKSLSSVFYNQISCQVSNYAAQLHLFIDTAQRLQLERPYRKRTNPKKRSAQSTNHHQEIDK